MRGRGGAGERDPVDVPVSGERSARAGARAMDDVEHAGWEPGLIGEVAEQRARERRPLGRLQHDRVAGRERRPDPPGREHERRVPRSRDRGHAGRVVADPVALATVERAGAGREAVAREVGEEADVVGRAREDPQVHRLIQGAVVDALDLGQVGDGGVDRVGQSREMGVSPVGSKARPLREGPACGRHGSVDLGLPSVGHLGELPVPPVDRAADLERRLAGDATPVDVVVEGDADALDLGCVCAHGVARSVRTVRMARTSSSVVR